MILLEIGLFIVLYVFLGAFLAGLFELDTDDIPVYCIGWPFFVLFLLGMCIRDRMNSNSKKGKED